MSNVDRQAVVGLQQGAGLALRPPTPEQALARVLQGLDTEHLIILKQSDLLDVELQNRLAAAQFNVENAEGFAERRRKQLEQLKQILKGEPK